MNKSYRIKVTLASMLAAFLVLIGAAGSGSAMTIDFRDSAWEAADGYHEYTLGGITLKADPRRARLWHDNIDGIGIRYDYEDDEIEGSELLKMDFSTDVRLDSIFVADLFYECRSGNCYSETGSYSLDGGGLWNVFSAPNPSNPNGFLAISMAGVVTDSIWFQAPGKTGGEDHDFAVQAVEVSSVPEPGTIVLLAAGMLGFALLWPHWNTSEKVEVVFNKERR